MQVALSDGGQEPVHDLLLLGRADRHPRAPSRDVVASPVGDLPDGGGRLADRLRDLVVRGVEHLAKHEHGALAGPSVSSTVSIAIETLSASSTSAATSGLVNSGSGSHSPTYSSRRRATDRSRFSA